MSRTWAWAQLAVAYGLLEVTLWTGGRAQKLAALLTAVWVVAATLISRRSAGELGLGFEGLRPSLIAIPIAAAAGMVIIIIAWQVGTLRQLFGATPPLWHSLSYAVWTLVQQFLLNAFFYLNLEEALGSRSRRALWGAIALFSLAHIPNPVLMAATFAAGLFFVSLFRRYRNIYPLGVAHAMLGLALACSVPDAYLRHMRVGISYLGFVGSW